MLVDEVHSWAEAQKLPLILYATAEDNLPMIELLKGFGYTLEREQDEMVLYQVHV